MNKTVASTTEKDEQVSMLERQYASIRNVSWLFFAVVLSYTTISAIFLGDGNVIGGKISHGHYYLHKGLHDIEVSKSVYIYSYIHGIASVLSMFVVVAGGIKSIQIKSDISRWKTE